MTLGLAVFLTACSSTGKHVENVPLDTFEPKSRADLAYNVRPGDFLSRIAQNTTGNGENWRAIARHNNIEDPNKLNKNDTIMIPGRLLPVEKSETAVKENSIVSIVEKPAIVEMTRPNSKLEKAHQAKSSSKWVMVEGSYYPKAIYRKPNYSAGMLTRVLPGTTLKHIKSGENWIQVETDKGRGYLHRSDARMLGKNEISLNSTEY